MTYKNDFGFNADTDELHHAPAWSDQPVTIPLEVYTGLREQVVRLTMERDADRQARYRAEAELAKMKEGE